MADITFRNLAEQEYGGFHNDVKDILSISVINEFGLPEDDPDIISDKDIDNSLYDPQCETLAIYADGRRAGGAVVRIDSRTQHNWLELFYIYPEMHSRGLGLQIWQQIERRYPRTKVWRLITPYFEKRNIHFYVNKCGFRIVEFFNQFHRDSDRPISRLPFHDEYFIFEKVMKQQKLFIPENKAAAHSPAGLPARPQQAHGADRTFPH